METRNIQFMVDTNILIDLHNYNKSPTEFCNSTNEKHFCEIKALANLLDEDMNKGRDSEIKLIIPQRVMGELMSGFSSFGGEIFNIVRRYDITLASEMEKDKSEFKLLHWLLRGTNMNYPQFNVDLFDDENDNDCKIICSAIMRNLPILTSNIKHFAGENNSIQNEILNRLDVCSNNNYVKKNFDLQYDKYKAYSISSFLEELYPDKYAVMNNELKQMRNKGGRD